MKLRHVVTIIAPIFISSFFICIASAQEGWVNVASGTTNSLHAVSFPDSNTAFAVGDGGVLLRSNNGGASWMSLSTGTNVALRSIIFIDANTGFVVGDNGTILRTTNSGDTWVNQTSGTTAELASVSFVNSYVGKAVGQSGTVLSTSDGGANWTSQTLRSTDGGNTWANQTNGSAINITGIAVIDSSKAFISGIASLYPNVGLILRTTDGGSTWTRVAGGITPLWGISLSGDFGIVGSTGTSRAIAGYYGFLVTHNGGNSWDWYETGVPMPENENLYGVDANTSIMVGTSGMIFHGLNSSQTSGTSSTLYGISFANSNDGIIVGAGGIILRTTNSGAAPPLEPVLKSPVNGTMNIATNNVTVAWDYSSGTDRYRLQVAKDSTFSSPILDVSNFFGVGGTVQNGMTYRVDNLEYGTTYYWRANAINSYGASEWSNVWSFTTINTNSVYDESLHSPWINASWGGNIDFNDTTQAYSGSHAIKVALISAWGGLSLHYGDWGDTSHLDLSGYQSLELAANGGTSGSNLNICFEDNNSNPGPIINSGYIPAGQWKAISIPMSQLNPNNQTFTRLSMQDITGAADTFYLDDIKFVDAPQAMIASHAPSRTEKPVEEENIPLTFSLYQNYPNPFNPTTTIRFAVPVSGFVSLKVYDVLGREVSTLVSEQKSPGTYAIQFNGSSLASGMYIYRLQAEAFVQTRKLLVQK